MTATKGTFISYRRSKGSMWALALHQRLTMQPDSVDVFYDIEELKAGPRQRHRGPLAESARRGRTGELCAVHHIFIDVIAGSGHEGSGALPGEPPTGCGRAGRPQRTEGHQDVQRTQAG